MKKIKLNISKCPITHTMNLIGGKWSLPIVFVLMKKGKTRFKDLERSIDGINTRMLVKELKRLEENEILIREVFAEVPPRVEYSLTQKGHALKNILTEMKSWGSNFIKI